MLKEAAVSQMLLEKFFTTDIAFDQKAFAAVFFDQSPGFSGVLLFFQVND